MDASRVRTVETPGPVIEEVFPDTWSTCYSWYAKASAAKQKRNMMSKATMIPKAVTLRNLMEPSGIFWMIICQEQEYEAR